LTHIAQTDIGGIINIIAILFFAFLYNSKEKRENMKKAIILFVVFVLLDFILYLVFGNLSGASMCFETAMIPFIIIEIAVYGSVIVYDIEKLDQKGDE